VARENERLRQENARLQRRLEQAETVIAVQKKLSDMLGIPLNPPPNGDDE
jgi:cell shape-determining protein MreC